MHGMASAFLLFRFRLQPAFCRTVEQFVRREAEPLNRCVDPGPFFGKELLALALQQQIARAVIDEHSEPSLAFNKLFVDQLLIALQNRERIDPVFGRDVAHRWQCIAFFEHAIEYHRHDTVAKLAVNRLTVVPLTVHPVFQIALYETYSSVILPAAIPVSVPQVRAMTLEQRPVCYSELQHQLACKRFFAISLPRPPSLAIRRRQREERCPSETGQSAPDFSARSALSSRILFFLAFSPLVTKCDQSFRVGVFLYQHEFSFWKCARKRRYSFADKHWHYSQIQFIHQVIPQKFPRQLASTH